MPEFRFRIGENELIVKNGDRITVGLVIKDRETITIAKKNSSYIIAFELSKTKAFRLGLTLLNFYSSAVTKKAKAKKKKETVSIEELDELLSETKAKAKKSEETEEAEEATEETESLINSME